MYAVAPSFAPSDRPLKKSKWTCEEDEQLRSAVRAYGTDSWNRISSFVPARTGKQCRERWIGRLSPAVSTDTWLPTEDQILIQAHAMRGNCWALIASKLPGWSALNVKNRWNWLARHTAGVDPSRFVGIRGCDADLSSSSDTAEKQCRPPFDPLMYDALFGTAFRQFQAKMFM
jgi:hypothetical protein